MIADKEEQFVFLDRAAEHASELVALEVVVGGREKVASIQVAIAEKLENVSMKRIGAGFGHGVHCSGGAPTLRSVLRAHAQPEFLERIRKRKRHVLAKPCIQMRRPVQGVLDTEGGATGDRDLSSAVYRVPG